MKSNSIILTTILYNMDIITYRPAFEADEIAFSAKLNPSADPMAIDVHCLPC